jgi:hypothetical protein
VFSRRGHTNAGEQRYRCGSDSCRKTFTGLTGTPFARIQGKSILLKSASCMRSFMSVRDVADELGIHRNTAFRYRRLMMPMLEKHQPAELPGVAEADEMYFRRSYQGQKKGIPRPSHKRGERASKRGISNELVPVLTAIARGTKDCFISVLPSVPNAVLIGSALKPLLKPDSVLVSDSASAYKTAAKTMGVTLRQIPRGAHKLGPYHIQNVNALHSRIRGGLFTFRGVASKYLAALAGFVSLTASTARQAHVLFLLDAFGMPATNTI